MLLEDIVKLVVFNIKISIVLMPTRVCVLYVFFLQMALSVDSTQSCINESYVPY